MLLTVKELSSWPETVAYYRMLRMQAPVERTLPQLGQAAFQFVNGSVVVRKDWKVLSVDVTSLPSEFGVPQSTRSDLAVGVADAILICWAGD
jgi:hypothetical protein